MCVRLLFVVLITTLLAQQSFGFEVRDLADAPAAAAAAPKKAPGAADKSTTEEKTAAPKEEKAKAAGDKTTTTTAKAPTAAAAAVKTATAKAPASSPLGSDELGLSVGIAIAAWCGCCIALTALLQIVATVIDGQPTESEKGGKAASHKRVGPQGGRPVVDCQASCKPLVRRWAPCWYECCCRKKAPVIEHTYGAGDTKSARGKKKDGQKQKKEERKSYAASKERGDQNPHLDDGSTVYSYEDRYDYKDQGDEQDRYA